MLQRTIWMAAILALVPASVRADGPLGKTVQGKVDAKSLEAMSFGPGVLLLGDGRGGQVFAVKVPDMPVQKWAKLDIADIAQTLAERLGTTAKGIDIVKLAVEPKSQMAFFLVRNLQGKQDALLTMDASGKIGPFSLDQVEYARVQIPAQEKSPVTKITDIVWSGKGILVAAQANETFASKILVIPGPISHDSTAQLFSAETYHVAHRNWETRAPIRTVLPYEENGKQYLVGAFTCTPIVKYNLDNLKDGAKVKGESMIEIGSGNTPLDMFTYQKDGKTYILMNTFRFHHAKAPVGPNPYWTVKVDQDVLRETSKINENAVWRVGAKDRLTDKATVAENFHGVVHMDKLNNEAALVVRTQDKSSYSLSVVPLP